MNNIEEKVNHPEHYKLKNFEVIDIIQDSMDAREFMGFCRGNAIKYLLRAGKKTESNYTPHAKRIEDLNKCIWYIQKEIKEIEQIKDNI